MNPEIFQSYAERVIGNCGKVIVGKEEVIRQITVSFLCGGHVLLEDVPGTGKTMLLRSFAKTVGGDFCRIQFTPDLLPSDLTGINFYNQKSGEFEFRKGPLFSGMILADEINRATPRTQSALLEAMEERQVTVDGTTYPMATPFMVMATQNPIESYGTFPLPEAQVDRFFMRLSMGYMTREQELAVISRASTLALVENLEQVVTAEETARLQEGYHEVKVSGDVAGYIMDIVTATRETTQLVSGVSTRGAIALYKAAQVTAAMEGRDYVIPEDVVREAIPVLAHRITASSGARKDAEIYLRSKMDKAVVPLENIESL
ncbi:MAG: AAA family ATPase [Faecousia sp.]